MQLARVGSTWYQWDARSRSWRPLTARELAALTHSLRAPRPNAGKRSSAADLDPSGKPLPPESPIPCRGREKEWLGRMIPGRHGGTVSACATPRRDERQGSHRLMVGLPMRGGETVTKSQARERFYPRPRHWDKEAAQHVGSAARSRVPGPVEMEFPHSTRSPCCALHPLWGPEYQAALEDAEHRLGMRAQHHHQAAEGEYARDEEPPVYVPGGADDVPFAANPRRRANKRRTTPAATAASFEEQLRAQLAQHPRGPEWIAAHDQCATNYRRREKRRSEARGHTTAATDAAELKRAQWAEASRFEEPGQALDVGALDPESYSAAARPKRKRR